MKSVIRRRTSGRSSRGTTTRIWFSPRPRANSSTSNAGSRAMRPMERGAGAAVAGGAGGADAGAAGAAAAGRGGTGAPAGGAPRGPGPGTWEDTWQGPGTRLALRTPRRAGTDGGDEIGRPRGTGGSGGVAGGPSAGVTEAA